VVTERESLAVRRFRVTCAPFDWQRNDLTGR